MAGGMRGGGPHSEYLDGPRALAIAIRPRGSPHGTSRRLHSRDGASVLGGSTPPPDAWGWGAVKPGCRGRGAGPPSGASELPQSSTAALRCTPGSFLTPCRFREAVREAESAPLAEIHTADAW